MVITHDLCILSSLKFYHLKLTLFYPLCLQLHLEAKKQEGSLEALRTELEQSQQDKHEKVCAIDILYELHLLYTPDVDICFKHIYVCLIMTLSILSCECLLYICYVYRSCCWQQLNKRESK